MKALSEKPTIDFGKIRIVKVIVGDRELWGDCVLGITLPHKGFPAWEVRYEEADGKKVIYAASTSIVIEAVEIEQEQEDEVIEDDE